MSLYLIIGILLRAISFSQYLQIRNYSEKMVFRD
jgi:hypothetical protein